MASKIFILSVIALCLASTKTAFAAEADWEILNLAISNPGEANPEVLKNSVFNILESFIPNNPPAPPAPPATPAPTQAPTQAPTAAPKPIIVAAPAPAPPAPAPVFPPFPIFIPQPPAPQAQPQPYPYPYPIYPPQPQPQAQPLPVAVQPQPLPVAVQPQPQPQPIGPNCNICNTPAPCKHQQKSIAEFLVDVPCPTTTPKPIRQIVVRVPCATTTKKPCECQCCPCNPCPTQKPPKLTRKNFKPKESSEEESQEETKTIYKSYDPVIKKYVDAKRNDDAKSSINYEPRGNYQRVQYKRDFDESFY